MTETEAKAQRLCWYVDTRINSSACARDDVHAASGLCTMHEGQRRRDRLGKTRIVRTDLDDEATFKLPSKDRKAIQAHADAEDRLESEVLRDAVRVYLNLRIARPDLVRELVTGRIEDPAAKTS